MVGVFHRIDEGTHCLELVEGPFVPDALEASEAVALLRWTELRDGGASLRCALSEAGFAVHPNPDVEHLREQVEMLLQTERLRLRRVEQPRPRVTHELPVVDLADLLPSRNEPEVTRTRSFVEFRLVDEDGDPVADHRFQLSLPDGRVVNGRTDANGRYRLGNLDPGGDATLMVDPGR